MTEIEGGVEGLDINNLLKENEILSDNLAKCMEEKNFVWSLWKKLQTEKPDLSSVVSLVMAREKEKNEVRDAKVLNILEAKDLQIQQLEYDNGILDADCKQKEDDLKAYSLRLHDLLIEKAELQENLESIKTEHEEKMKSLVEENAYLSEVVHARQIKLESDKNAYKLRLDDVDKEKQELNDVVEDLELRLNKLTQEKLVNTAMMEENMNLKNDLDLLQEQLINLKQEHDDGMTALRLRERQLQQHSNTEQENKKLLNGRDEIILALKQELSEAKLVHDQCGEYAKEQSTLIQNLQSLQEQTQLVMKVQDEKFKSEILKLKEQLKDSHKLRESLEADIEESKLQECESCSTLKEELQSLQDKNEELLEIAQEKNRRISSLKKTVIAKDGDLGGNSTYETLARKCKSSEQKIYELQKVLAFKQNELDAIGSAHSNRQQRYKNLQHEHKIVLKQLKTFENSSDEERKKRAEEQPMPRASPRALQKEQCTEAAWNELQYFKTEYEKLSNERDGIMEEIDVLRVQHANDLTTIQELRMCLEDEKRDLVEQIKVNNAEENEEMQKANERLQKQNNDLALQMKTVKNDCRVSEKEKETLKGELRQQEQLVERLAGEISRYKKELKVMKSERKKRKENENKTTQVDDASMKDHRELTPVQMTDKQIQTDTTFEKELHEATRLLLLDATRGNLPQNNNNVSLCDAQTSPLKTTAETSTSIEYTSHAERTTTIDETLTTHDRSTTKDGKILGSEIPGSHELSNRSAFETPAKKARRKSPIHREWRSMRQRVLSLTQQVTALKSAKESLSKSLNEEKSLSEKVQNDLNQCQQRAKISKQTMERLSKELEESQRKNEAHSKLSKEYKIPSYPTEKHLEDRLKLSSNECSRLSHELKSARKVNEELEERLKSLQEKNSRQEHTLNQKKVFVDEMRSRLKVTLEKLETTQETLQEAEEKIRLMTDKENQRKVQIDSLKNRLETEMNEKKNIHKVYTQSQEELKKKAKLLSQAQALRHEAEMAVNEMEEAATTQLHNLANQSQVTLNSIEQRLTRSRERLEEFQVVIRTLAQRLTEQITNKRLEMKREKFEKYEEEKKTASMLQACELASSILNMSKADIDELLDVNVENEESLTNDQVQQWNENVDEILSQEESFAAPLVQILLDIVENLVLLERGISDDENRIR